MKLGQGAKMRRKQEIQSFIAGRRINEERKRELQVKRNLQLAHARKIRKQPKKQENVKKLPMKELRRVGMDHNKANRIQLSLRKKELQRKVNHQRKRMGKDPIQRNQTVKEMKDEARSMNDQSIIKGGITRLSRKKLEDEIVEKQNITHGKHAPVSLDNDTHKAVFDEVSRPFTDEDIDKIRDINETNEEYINRVIKYVVDRDGTSTPKESIIRRVRAIIRTSLEILV